MFWRKARRNSFDPDVLLDRDDQGPSADFMESLKERVVIVIVIVIVVIIVIYNNKSWTWVTTLQTLSVSRVSQHNTWKKIKQNLGTGGSFHVTDMENIHSLVILPLWRCWWWLMNNMIGKYTFNGCCVLAGPENFLRPRFGPSERELARTGDLFGFPFCVIIISTTLQCQSFLQYAVHELRHQERGGGGLIVSSR